MNEKSIRSEAFRMKTEELIDECYRLKMLIKKTDEISLRIMMIEYRCILLEELASRQMKLKGF